MKKYKIFDKAREFLTDAANFHSRTGKGTKGRLGSRSRGFCPVTTGCPQFDVKGGNSTLACLDGNILRSKHSGIRGRFVAVGLDFHATRDFCDGFTTSQISNVLRNKRQNKTNEGVQK